MADNNPSVPRHRLLRWVQRLEAINEWIGRGVAWLALGMVLVTFLVVVLRYLFDMGWIAMQESVIYMHAVLFMAGSAYTLRHQGHVRVDIFYRRYSPVTQAWVDLLGSLLLLMPVCLFILLESWPYVSSAWAIHEGSREAGGIEGVYLLKSMIPVMAVLMMVQGVAAILRSLLVLNGVLDSPTQTLDTTKEAD